MRKYLRRLLGLDEDMRDITSMIQTLHQDIVVMRSDFTLMLGADEFDPKRREASDKIGEIIRKRLAAEDWARKHTTGEDQ